MSTHNIPFSKQIRESPLIIPKSPAMGSFPREFETAVVNEPSVFEPLKFYCIVRNIEKIAKRLCLILHTKRYKRLEFNPQKK